MFAEVTPGLHLARVQSGRVKSKFGGWMQLAKAGTADLLGSWHGRALAVEAKAVGGKQSPEQKQFEQEWIKAGGLYLLATDVLELQRALQAIP